MYRLSIVVYATGLHHNPWETVRNRNLHYLGRRQLKRPCARFAPFTAHERSMNLPRHTGVNAGELSYRKDLGYHYAGFHCQVPCCWLLYRQPALNAFAARRDGTTSSSSAAAESLSSNIPLQLSSITLKTSQRPTPTTKVLCAKATNSQSGKHSHHTDDLDVAPKGSSISSSASPTQSAGGNSKTSSSDGNSNLNSNSSNGSNKGSTTDQSHSNNAGSDDKNNTGDDSDSNDDNDDDDSSNTNSGFPKFLPNNTKGSPCEVVNENDGRLQYTGTWVLESKDPNGIYFTTHTTSTAGSAVTISFNGTSITIIGIVHASNNTVPPAIASYIIDDGASVSLPLPISNRDIPNQQFFESPILDLSAHKLVINITSDGSPYTLDTLLICTQGNGAVATVLTPTSRVTRSATPAIIGGVIVGAVAFIFLLILGVVLLHRRRRGMRARRTAESPIKSWLHHTIFTSSESIMRNNPSNPSTMDPYEKPSRAVPAKGPTDLEAAQDMPSIYRHSKILPPSPEIHVKADPGVVEDARRSVHRLSDRSSILMPTLSLSSRSISDKPELPLSALPEAYHTLPPHPPLPAKPGYF
ncbi:hypothetical protein PHLGIDRAFT_15167 [Phlebiopsis gigantea 11061_1 CR5-6]|uniref:Uncharacterized protein n=1 Tax=Phlebiopsis gigantea (strain 11061_1 CR5-6) TaxID=745531 RepID=A0A0C3PFT6_PHLG1|nr:hypothetical protein PHLGIDRAFT_15167 [Phlebiopsis gigantea 11061_1 CR5-6]